MPETETRQIAGPACQDCKQTPTAEIAYLDADGVRQSTHLCIHCCGRRIRMTLYLGIAAEAPEDRFCSICG